MNGLEATIGINGFSNGFWSINHWSRWFFRLATIGLDGFAMVFGLATIGLDGFSMVANHWSNDGMVTIHRYGLGCNYNDDRNDEWNNLIYTTIGEEQNDLRHQGFRVCIVGDMNGHIGCQPGIGIIRNKPHINQNGQMLLNFESNNDLCIMKKEASGLWT